MATQANKIAICLGGAMSAWEELERAREMAPDAMLVACNNAGRDIDGPLDIWVTMHPDLMPKWEAARSKAGKPDAGLIYHAGHRAGKIKRSIPIASWGGSSGLLTITCALENGATHVILCGIPLHQHGRHYDGTHKLWGEASQYRGAWERHLPKMEGKVKSFSGWTARLLGEPTKDWLDGDTRAT